MSHCSCVLDVCGINTSCHTVHVLSNVCGINTSCHTVHVLSDVCGINTSCHTVHVLSNVCGINTSCHTVHVLQLDLTMPPPTLISMWCGCVSKCFCLTPAARSHVFYLLLYHIPSMTKVRLRSYGSVLFLFGWHKHSIYIDIISDMSFFFMSFISINTLAYDTDFDPYSTNVC